MISLIPLLLMACSALVPDNQDCEPGEDMGQLRLQQGLAAYQGTADATITDDTPRGMEQELQLFANASGLSRIYLRFDLPEEKIEPEKTIESALVHLFQQTASSKSSSLIPINLHQLKVRTAEEHVTQDRYDDDQPWQKQYGLIGGDMEQEPSGSFNVEPNDNGVWLKIDVTDSIRTWQSQPSGNHGWILLFAQYGDDDPEEFASTANLDIHFSSAQADLPEQRPILEIFFQR